MSDDIEEVEEITAICQGLNINIGTLNQQTIPAMIAAGKKANELGHPVVFDPVGVGASTLRTQTAKTLMEQIHFTVIRGNISEIKTLAQGHGNTKGVDADVADQVTESNLSQTISFAKNLAQKTDAIIVITGAIDIIANKNTAYCIRNGHPAMSKITGTGCQLSAMIAAYITANPDNFLTAAVAAVAAMGLCGEIAANRMNELDGNSSYRNYIIDAVNNLTPDYLEQGANYEVC